MLHASREFFFICGIVTYYEQFVDYHSIINYNYRFRTKICHIYIHLFIYIIIAESISKERAKVKY